MARIPSSPSSPAPAAIAAARRVFVPCASPTLGPEAIADVVETLVSGRQSSGPCAVRFERPFAEHTAATHAVAVNSCTAALHVPLLAVDTGEGDEVITTPPAFCATANGANHAGSTPVFTDIDADTFTLHSATLSLPRSGRSAGSAGRVIEVPRSEKLTTGGLR